MRRGCSNENGSTCLNTVVQSRKEQLVHAMMTPVETGKFKTWVGRGVRNSHYK